MANLKNLSERIKSVTSIQQVTKAMKMVAAAKVKKAQDKMEISRPYSKNTQELICRILPQISSTDISLVEKRDVKNIGIIVISSDRGFAGSFNSSDIRKVEKEIEKIGKDKVYLFCIGKKSNIYHKELSGLINSSDIDKVFVKGEKTLFTYKHLKKQKRGNIFQCNEDIDFILKNIIANNDYLMIKGSNATGLNIISKSMIKGI